MGITIKPIEITSLTFKEPLLNSPNQNLTIKPINIIEIYQTEKKIDQQSRDSTDGNLSNYSKINSRTLNDTFLQNYQSLMNRQTFIKEMKQRTIHKLLQGKKIKKDIETFIGGTLFKRQEMIKNLIDRQSLQFQQLDRDEAMQQTAYQKVCEKMKN